MLERGEQGPGGRGRSPSAKESVTNGGGENQPPQKRGLRDGAEGRRKTSWRGAGEMPAGGKGWEDEGWPPGDRGFHGGGFHSARGHHLIPSPASSKGKPKKSPAAASERPGPSRARRPPPLQRPHRCPDCDKAFSYPSKLATHRLAHGGARPHPCPDCDKAFSYPSKLAAHRLTHSGARPFPCPDCPKAFGHRSKLAAHRWTHSSARPYPCPDCPKSFCYPSKLAAHQRRHAPTATGVPIPAPPSPPTPADPQHRCPSCGQAFSQRRLLALHQRSHRGEGKAGKGGKGERA